MLAGGQRVRPESPGPRERGDIGQLADPRVAERISQQIDIGLDTPGAREITAELRRGPRPFWRGTGWTRVASSVTVPLGTVEVDLVAAW